MHTHIPKESFCAMFMDKCSNDRTCILQILSISEKMSKQGKTSNSKVPLLNGLTLNLSFKKRTRKESIVDEVIKSLRWQTFPTPDGTILRKIRNNRPPEIVPQHFSALCDCIIAPRVNVFGLRYTNNNFLFELSCWHSLRNSFVAINIQQTICFDRNQRKPQEPKWWQRWLPAKTTNVQVELEQRKEKIKLRAVLDRKRAPQGCSHLYQAYCNDPRAALATSSLWLQND